MNFLLTGGAGFVGSNLARTLQQRYPDARIVIVDDFRSGTFANLCPERDCDGPGVWSFAGQVVARPLHDFDLDHLLSTFEPDVIFHQASITDTTVDDQAKMIHDNVEPFEKLIAYAADAECRLVWASSAATYGTLANGAMAERRPFRLEDAGHPANVYGFSKWMMENIHREALEAMPDMHLVGLRYFNVFGPGEAHKGKMASMIYQITQQMLAGKRPRVFTDGTQARDQIHVDDVVAANLAAAADDATPGIYNVGAGVATSFNDIIDALNEALNTELAPDYFDNPYSFYQDYTCADISETQTGLNWTPQRNPREAIIAYAQTLAAADKK
ncbi:MAG: NAD-dependent epimerase/dehydratase family protein [Phycisphaeraceae bacterium]